jgi:N-acetylglutamate synthase-like GNAT family acetyltransferase
MSYVRIRLADWRDREAVQPLRRMVERPLDGGLYELLNWNMYHTHTALVEGRVVGMTSIVLLQGGIADDVTTVILPDYRRQGIASQLRATQLRDLMEMGRQYLFALARTEEAASWLTTHMDEVIHEEDLWYFGAPVETAFNRLLERGTPAPYPLSPERHAKLLARSTKADQEIQELAELAQVHQAKAALRVEYIQGAS